MVLVTAEYDYQSNPLTMDDFSAVHACMLELNAVGFFNSHFNAGASQKHKHLQMVPLDVMWESRMQAGQHDAEYVSRRQNM